MDENLGKIKRLLEKLKMFGCSLESCRWCGRLRADFARQGIVFDHRDLVIAAIALAEAATVVSDDQVFVRHPVDGLPVEN